MKTKCSEEKSDRVQRFRASHFDKAEKTFWGSGMSNPTQFASEEAADCCGGKKRIDAR